MHQEDKDSRPLIVAITGASGSVLAATLIDRLLEMAVNAAVVASSPARMVWQEEMEESFGAALERWKDNPHFKYYSNSDLLTPIASGTYPTRGMVIIPCSMATLAAIVIGMANNLIRRGADVCLKERRPLVIVPRETPLTAVHLENMAKIARMGAVVLPPEPAFYLHPKEISDVVRFITERILVALGITQELPKDLQYRHEE